MEYLTSINNPLNKINEINIQYLNIFNNPSLVFGNTLNSNKVDFCKYSQEQHSKRAYEPYYLRVCVPESLANKVQLCEQVRYRIHIREK